MGTIQLLDDALVDQIAAGEVVERPASVVKELLENCIDAKATNIQVEIVEGGRERIRIVDDGVGMDAEDALLCVKRHATSKLRTLEELTRVQTMGFRGEALASIASVSKFRLRTRQRDAVQGTEVVVEGGGAPVVRPVGCPPGTSIEVDELFYNLPARRKFLRARATEQQHVARTCLDIALAHPKLRLSYATNGRVAREYLPAEDRVARAKALFDGPHAVVDGERDGIRFLGVFEPPKLARAGMRHLHLFVNDRPVVDVHVARAIAFAFGESLAKGHYPTGAAFLHLDPEHVDVNAHPRKTEVRFARIGRVQDAITRIVADGLGTTRWQGGVEGGAAEARQVEAEAPPSSAAPGAAGGPMARAARFWEDRLPSGPGAEPKPKAPAEDAPKPAASAPGGLASALREGRAPGASESPPPAAPSAPAKSAGATSRAEVSAPVPVGEVDGLLLYHWRHALVVVDVTALARRVTRATWSAGIEAARLLFPQRVELDTDQVATLVEARDVLRTLGVEVSALGDSTIALHTLPAVDERFDAECDPETLLEAALEADEAELLTSRIVHAGLADGVGAADLASLVAQFPDAARTFDLSELRGEP